MPVQLRVLFPEPPVSVGGVTVQVRPVLGDIAVVRVTVPVNPFSGSTRMLVVPATPGVVVMVAGLANIWKSTTWTRALAVVWESLPMVPVTFAV